MRQLTRALAVAVTTLMVSACGNAWYPETQPPPSTIADVAVTQELEAVPVMSLNKKPFLVKQSEVKILKKGDPEKPVRLGSRLVVKQLIVSGYQGDVVLNTFSTKTPDLMVIQAKEPERSVFPGLIKLMTGDNPQLTIGARALITLPAIEAYGYAGFPERSVSPADSIAMIIEIVKEDTTVLAKATGKSAEQDPTLPTVALDKSGTPAITLPQGDQLATKQIEVLIQGTGDTVATGDYVTMHVEAMNWRTGRTFMSSWRRKAPITQSVGKGQLLPGIDDAVNGAKVGTQLLLVLPPDFAYGTNGYPQFGVEPGDTLVYVIDILAK